MLHNNRGESNTNAAFTAIIVFHHCLIFLRFRLAWSDGRGAGEAMESISE